MARSITISKIIKGVDTTNVGSTGNVFIDSTRLPQKTLTVSEMGAINIDIATGANANIYPAHKTAATDLVWFDIEIVYADATAAANRFVTLTLDTTMTVRIGPSGEFIADELVVANATGSTVSVVGLWYIPS